MELFIKKKKTTFSLRSDIALNLIGKSIILLRVLLICERTYELRAKDFERFSTFFSQIKKPENGQITDVCRGRKINPGFLTVRNVV